MRRACRWVCRCRPWYWLTKIQRPSVFIWKKMTLMSILQYRERQEVSYLIQRKTTSELPVNCCDPSPKSNRIGTPLFSCTPSCHSSYNETVSPTAARSAEPDEPEHGTHCSLFDEDSLHPPSHPVRPLLKLDHCHAATWTDQINIYSTKDRNILDLLSM